VQKKTMKDVKVQNYVLIKICRV